MSDRISSQSTQSIYVPINGEIPSVGPVDFSAGVAKVAIVNNEPVDSDFQAATMLAGTWKGPDGFDYYIAEFEVIQDSLAKGQKQVWIEVALDGDRFRARAGPIAVY